MTRVERDSKVSATLTINKCKILYNYIIKSKMIHGLSQLSTVLLF